MSVRYCPIKDCLKETTMSPNNTYEQVTNLTKRQWLAKTFSPNKFKIIYALIEGLRLNQLGGVPFKTVLCLKHPSSFVRLIVKCGTP